MVCMVTLLVTFLDIACDRTWTDRRRAVTLSAFCCCWIAGRARFRGACAFAIAFGAAALALLNADDLRRSALTPWSATCYPTRPAEGVSAAQAEYEGLAGHHGCHPKCRGRAGSRRISDSWPAQADGHAFAFCGAIYLSLGRRQRSATLRLKNEVGGRDVDLALKLNVLAVLAVFAFVGAILLGAL